MTHSLARVLSPLASGLIFLGVCLSGWQQVPSNGATPGQEPPGGPASSMTINQPEVVETALTGRVLDANSRKPLAGATVYHNGKAVQTTDNGTFRLEKPDSNKAVLIKCPGYRQISIAKPLPELQVELAPRDVKGLYLTHYGIGYKPLRDNVFELIRDTDLNAVVMDVKGDRGLLSSKYDVPLAQQIGAMKITTVRDIRALIEQLHRDNVYVIARIVVFKDNILAHAKPELAIMDTRTKEPWIDNEHLAWVDPFRREVWAYDISIAIEAAKAGFDEIQFDYVRFPTDGRLTAARYSQPNTMENRVKTINSFLETAQAALLPYNVYFSADIFGYTPWNYNDTDIGQKIEDVTKFVDYICLMVYPSGYHLGIPGYLQPVAHPYEVVYYTLEKAKKRLGGQEKKLRPWLQNFRDYAFDRRAYTATEIKLQIDACKKADIEGYMLWDPSNKYRYTANAMGVLKADAQQQTARAGRGPVGAK